MRSPPDFSSNGFTKKRSPPYLSYNGATKKNKKAHKSINNRLTLVNKSGKHTLDYKTVLKTLRSSKDKVDEQAACIAELMIFMKAGGHYAGGDNGCDDSDSDFISFHFCLPPCWNVEQIRRC